MYAHELHITWVDNNVLYITLVATITTVLLRNEDILHQITTTRQNLLNFTATTNFGV